MSIKFGRHQMEDGRHEASCARYKITFPNGYGASVIKGSYTYGGSSGLWELAVTDKFGHLNFSTPITGDVLGFLTPDEVADTLDKIEALA